MKKIFHSLLFTAFITVLLSCGAIFSSAYGDSIASATSISIENEYTGTISATNTSDCFEFNLSESGSVNISAKAYMNWVYYRLYDENGNELFYSNPSWNGTTRQSTINETIYLTSGKYYFTVSKAGYDGNYSFKLSFTSSKESFKEGQGGNNNVLASADTVSFSKTYNGMLAKNDSIDFYKVTIPSTGALNISSIAKINWIWNEIYDIDGNKLWGINPCWNNTSKQSTNNDTIYLNSGTYYISFSWNGGYTGNYNFKLTFTSSDESFKETGFGVNNSIDTASKISLNKTYKGAICQNDTQDMYKFTVTSNMNAILSFSSKGMGWIYITIFDSVGNQIARYNPRCNDSKIITISEVITLSKGTYYLSVSKNDSSGNYYFTISDGKPGKTSNLTATPKSNEIKLTWKAVEGATGYRVYQYDYNKKKSSSLVTFEGTSYTVKNLKANTKYRFSVKAYTVINGEKVWSDVYTIVETKTCPAIVSKLTATQTASSVKLTWSKVSGATGYKVYRYTDGKWKEIKSTTATSYNVQKLNSGTKYKFAVKAYIKNSDGKLVYSSSYKSIATATKPLATSITKISSTSKGKAVINWNNVSGETGYQIYYSTSKDSGFKKYAAYKGNTVKATVSNLKSGKYYYFKIRSYKNTDSGTVYSAWSSVKSVKIK